MSSFCCEEMSKHILEEEVALKYYPVLRSYGLKILDGGRSVQSIRFCPWCGRALPSDLSDKFWELIEALEKKQGFEFDSWCDPRLPPEFKTDEWWKKRGL